MPPRKLPWKDKGADTTKPPPAGRGKAQTTRIKREVKSESPSPGSPFFKKEEEEDEDVKPTILREEEFMLPGLDCDDGYIMVEDQLMTLAHGVTKHLHAAAYEENRATKAKLKEESSRSADSSFSSISDVKKGTAVKTEPASSGPRTAVKTEHEGTTSLDTSKKGMAFQMSLDDEEDAVYRLLAREAALGIGQASKDKDGKKSKSAKSSTGQRGQLYAMLRGEGKKTLVIPAKGFFSGGASKTRASAGYATQAGFGTPKKVKAEDKSSNAIVRRGVGRSDKPPAKREKSPSPSPSPPTATPPPQTRYTKISKPSSVLRRITGNPIGTTIPVHHQIVEDVSDSSDDGFKARQLARMKRASDSSQNAATDAKRRKSDGTGSGKHEEEERKRSSFGDILGLKFSR